MWNFLAPPAFKPEQTGSEADERYRRLRWQVFIGIFIGYAGFYIVRKNFSMAIPMLAPFGFEKGELGVVLSMNAIAYGFSKFVMASISDRSNAQRFLPLGLILAAISMMFMIVPVQWIGADNKGLAITLMAVLNFLVLHQGAWYLDVLLELRPQRRWCPCRPDGRLWSRLVRIMVLRC